MADGHPVVATAFKCRHIAGEVNVKSWDEALAQCRSDEGRGNGLGHGERSPARRGCGTEFMVFKNNLSVFQDQQTCDAIVGKIVEEIVVLIARLETNVLELARC